MVIHFIYAIVNAALGGNYESTDQEGYFKEKAIVFI